MMYLLVFGQKASLADFVHGKACDRDTLRGVLRFVSRIADFWESRVANDRTNARR
jgi:hypothetical protein